MQDCGDVRMAQAPVPEGHDVQSLLDTSFVVSDGARSESQYASDVVCGSAFDGHAEHVTLFDR